jgi:hypothetical protein
MLKKALSLAVLAVWVLAGPIAMAFNGCAMMGSMCEAPCGASSYISSPFPPGLIALQPEGDLAAGSTPQTPDAVSGPPKPPPKSALFSA